MLNRKDGEKKITAYLSRYSMDDFCKSVTSGLWTFIQRHGEEAAMEWVDFLDDDFVKISSRGSFWSLLTQNRAGAARDLVEKWVPKVNHTGVGHRDDFWMVLAREGGDAFLSNECTFDRAGKVSNTQRQFAELQQKFLSTHGSKHAKVKVDAVAHPAAPRPSWTSRSAAVVQDAAHTAPPAETPFPGRTPVSNNPRCDHFCCAAIFHDFLPLLQLRRRTIPCCNDR